MGKLTLPFLTLILTSLTFCSYADELTPERQKELSKLVKKMPALSVSPSTTNQRLSDLTVKMSIDAIKEYPEVTDADVNQKSDEINLVVIVKEGTPVNTAKEMGDNFLRMLLSNSMGAENSPKKEIGSTKYSYIIGVYYPNEEQVALGAKSPASRSITW